MVKRPLDELRTQHPALVYKSFSYRREGTKLALGFEFVLEPEIRFRPELLIPCPAELDPAVLEPIIFQLGLVELISYWKAACPPIVRVEAGDLDARQTEWWRKLFLRGLGEFFYVNGIDFTAPNFLSFESCGPKRAPISIPNAKGQLILVGGGKDSVVTLELVKALPEDKAAFIVEGHPSALATTRVAGYTRMLVVQRTLDPVLLKLNRSGYLNGHTPFSALLAFVSVLTAAANGFRHVLASNELSADEPNTLLFGEPVNHQYSKSREFEIAFRTYCSEHLTPDVEYFSFLRPIYELQISRIFARYPRHFVHFRSCNVKQREDAWCGECPKCAFTALCLSPHLSPDAVAGIFSKDIFENPKIVSALRELTGLSGHKPFECVGTEQESIAAVQLAIEAAAKNGTTLSPSLHLLGSELVSAGRALANPTELLTHWSAEHSLPPEYELILREATR